MRPRSLSTISLPERFTIGQIRTSLVVQIQRYGGARPGLTGALQPGPTSERVREGKGLSPPPDCRRPL